MGDRYLHQSACVRIRHGPIGQAACTLFKAKAMVTIYETLRRTDPFGLFGLKKETDLAQI